MAEGSEDSNFEASAGPSGFSVKGKRTAEIITLLTLLTASVLAYAYYQHDKTTEVQMKEISAAMKDLAKAQHDATAAFVKAQQETVAAQRELTCIISLPQERREVEFSSPYGLCKRITSR